MPLLASMVRPQLAMQEMARVSSKVPLPQLSILKNNFKMFKLTTTYVVGCHPHFTNEEER